MKYRLGVDVGGTFTDLILFNENDSTNGKVFSVKLPSTPEDPSIGVIDGIRRICKKANVQVNDSIHIMHGTTVATNAILTGNGARVGLVTSTGYKYVLQIARSFIPGGLGAWVIFNKSPPLAPLSLTVEADERIDDRGNILQPLDENKLRISLKNLNKKNIEALTISFINAYANDVHEKIAERIAKEELPDIPISISSYVNPEIQEYERTITTVCNSFVRPIVSKYVRNLNSKIKTFSKDVKLHILRSDGGLTSPAGAEMIPVNLLMSGPAGGVAGAIWNAKKTKYKNFLTFDMGGTSTDVCVVKDLNPQTRRETTVGDLTVRASSLDVRTVGAGGGSIAHVPDLTGALRIGPQSAGALPGPAGYGKGGEKPTVTDANIVLGYLPETAYLGGDMKIYKSKAIPAIQSIAESLKFNIERAAEGIYNIVNERMIGALRLISIQQGYDPRDFALVAFGGAGPIHANALANILGSWPVIVPPAPGVLCAYGDATTYVKDEASRTIMKRFSETTNNEILEIFDQLIEKASAALDLEDIPRNNQTITLEADIRYTGQVLHRTVTINKDVFIREGLNGLGKTFDELHKRLYTFALDTEREIINLRAIVEDKSLILDAPKIKPGNSDSEHAKVGEQKTFFNGGYCISKIYDRSKLLSGNKIPGPAILIQPDTTTLIIPEHIGYIDEIGNIIIQPM